MSSDPERRLGERYRLIERIGAGGMASVFLAEDTLLGRRVAVKRLHAELPEDAARRFGREARLAAGLNHPNLVAVYDAFSGDDELVVVMEYVPGTDLSEPLRDGALPRGRALSVLAGLAAALDHLRDAGIVHRDVKPSNVLLGGDGDAVKLTDLGIARVVEDTATTQAHSVPGSLPYMSPEQLAGREAGSASDVYSFGLVAFEVLTGRRARGGQAAQIEHQAATGVVPDLRAAIPSAPAELVAAIEGALAPDPARRPQSAGSLVAEIAPHLDRLEPPEPARPEHGSPASRPSATSTAAAPAAQLPATQPVTPPPAPEPEPQPEPTPVPAPAREPVPEPARRRGPGALLAALALAAVAVAVVAVLVLNGGGTEEPGGGEAPAGEVASNDGGESGGGAGGGDGAGGGPGSPADAVEGFYTAAADGDFSTATELASPTLIEQLGGSSGLEGTFSTLESISFERLEVASRAGESAVVEFETTARHTDRVDSCAGSATLVASGGAWTLDSLDAVDCTPTG